MENKHFELIQEVTKIGTWEVKLDNTNPKWDNMVKEIHEVPPDFQPTLSDGINFYKEGFSRNKIQEVVKKCMETGEPYDVELQIVTYKNNLRWVRAIGKIEKDSGGKPIVMYGSFEDITKYKEEQDSARENQEIIQKANIGIWDWNPQTNEVNFSSGWKNMLGYSDSEIKPELEEWSARVHPDDIAGCYANIEKHMTGATDFYRDEHRMLTKSGEWLWILDQGQIVRRDEKGNPVRFIGTHLDISKKKENQKVLDRFFELSLEFICIANTNGEFERINPTFSKKLNYSEEELLGQPFFNFIHPDDVESTMLEVQKLAEGKPTLKFKNRFHKKNGEYLWLSWVTQPDKATGKLYAIARDITEEILQQAEKEKYAAQLQESNARLQEFASIASHDLKAPIRKIGLLCDFIEQDSDLDEAAEEHFRKIKSSTKSMYQLVSDLLLYSKVQNIELSMKNFSLQDMFLQIGNELNEEGKISIQNELPHIKADFTRMKEALINIVANGLKYNESSHKEVVIWYDEINQNLNIKDNGIGVPSDQRKTILKPFKRLHNQSEYEGTGAGLAITEKILTRHNITINIDSEMGKGSTFILNLRSVEKNTDNPHEEKAPRY